MIEVHPHGADTEILTSEMVRSMSSHGRNNALMTHMFGQDQGQTHNRIGVIFSDVLTKKMIFSVLERLSVIIPQVDDYLCPICQDISWKPIRLECGHIFCVRCLVKAQARKMRACPMCRAPHAVERVTTNNLDVARMNFLKLYFPNEIKMKAKDSSKEKASEDMLKIFGLADGSGPLRGATVQAVPGNDDEHGEEHPRGEATTVGQHGVVANSVSQRSLTPREIQTTAVARHSARSDACLLM